MLEFSRILVVEDDPDGQVVVSHVVTQTLAMPVDVAKNAKEALKFLSEQANAYRVAIIDLSMPEMDGWQLLSTIRNNPATAELPCVAMTAYHSSRTREEALKSGFVGYFSKPIDTVTFTQQLKKFMG
ncbi:MAG: response regulator [bacterium]|nr:response regulator [bacterium]